MELLQDEDLRERLRTRSREVAEQFRASKVAVEVEALLRAVIG